MLATLRSLKKLLWRDSIATPHERLEHEHWDREERTWRTHEGGEEPDADGA